ncbi:MAG: hypothetical protein J5653_02645 [Clostridiales bacterium]|nr:hypothetical protein [Clostridiales bacterium]
MTLIKSHSCTKCGGVLIVNNDKQQYECPYCGIFYDYEYFRSRDVLDQADSSLKVLQYTSAKEKYEFVLTKEPHNFRALIGKFLCDANISKVEELGKIENFRRITPASINESEEKALPDNKPFFSKLRIMNEYSKSYMNNRRKMQPIETLNQQKSKLLKELHEKEQKGEVYVESDPAGKVFLGGFFLVLAVVIVIVGYKVDPLDIGYYNYILAAVFIALGLCAIGSRTDGKEHYERTREDLKMKYNIDTLGTGKHVTVDEGSYEELKAKSRSIQTEFQKLYKELLGLLPEEKSSTGSEKTDSSEVNLKKSQSCAKCGGELIVNLDRQVYECPFCGMSYDFDFIRDDTAVAEAKDALDQCQFVEADAIFKYILTVDPKNFTALRGRVLCAAKWKNLETASKDIVSSMRKAHIPTVNERITDALSHCEQEDRPYFELFGNAISEYESYKGDMNPNSLARKEQKRLEKLQEEAEDYLIVADSGKDAWTARKANKQLKQKVEEASSEVNKLGDQGEHSKKLIEKYLREMVKIETSKGKGNPINVEEGEYEK